MSGRSLNRQNYHTYNYHTMYTRPFTGKEDVKNGRGGGSSGGSCLSNCILV